MRLRGLLAVLLFGLCARSAAAAPIVSVQPALSSVVLNDSFSVDVAVKDVLDLFGFQFDLGFDPTVLTVNSITEGPFLPSGGSSFFIPGDYTTTPGLIAFTADTLLGPVSGVSGAGVLATINFLAISIGSSPLALSNGLLVDSNGLTIDDASFESGSVTATPEPSTMLLFGSGLATAWYRRRKQHNA